MIGISRRFLTFLVIVLTVLVSDVTCQQEAQQQQQKGGEAGIMTEQDAHDIAAIIQAAKEDPDTLELVTKLKHDMSDTLNDLRSYSQEEILGGLKQSMEELKMLDYLFQDKKRALKEMEKDGLIDKDSLKKYKKNPDLLEQDTRQAIYFQFVSLAVVGGFL